MQTKILAINSKNSILSGFSETFKVLWAIQCPLIYIFAVNQLLPHLKLLAEGSFSKGRGAGQIKLKKLMHSDYFLIQTDSMNLNLNLQADYFFCFHRT